MTKPEGINLDVQPHHVKRGAEATKRAKERESRARATPIPPTPVQRNQGPFKRSGEAMAALTSALGYPPAVIPPLKVSWRHKAIPETDDE